MSGLSAIRNIRHWGKRGPSETSGLPVIRPLTAGDHSHGRISKRSRPARMQTDVGCNGSAPLLMRPHSGSPSAVIIESTRSPLESVNSISASLPHKDTETTLAPSIRLNALGHRALSLELPHQMRRLPSIRQPNSIISVHSPRGLR